MANKNGKSLRASPPKFKSLVRVSRPGLLDLPLTGASPANKNKIFDYSTYTKNTLQRDSKLGY